MWSVKVVIVVGTVCVRYVVGKGGQYVFGMWLVLYVVSMWSVKVVIVVVVLLSRSVIVKCLLHDWADMKSYQFIMWIWSYCYVSDDQTHPFDIISADIVLLNLKW